MSQQLSLSTNTQNREQYIEYRNTYTKYKTHRIEKQHAYKIYPIRLQININMAGLKKKKMIKQNLIYKPGK